MNKEDQAKIDLMSMKIGGGMRTVKKLGKEKATLENVLYDFCMQQANLRGLKLKFIELDLPTLKEEDLIVGRDEIPIYIADEMLNYEELFKRLGQEANPKIYSKLTGIESMQQKRLAKLRMEVRKYEKISGKKYHLSF